MRVGALGKLLPILSGVGHKFSWDGAFFLNARNYDEPALGAVIIIRGAVAWSGVVVRAGAGSGKVGYA